MRLLNVVVVTMDTLCADRLHCYGYQRIETPALDRLVTKRAEIPPSGRKVAGVGSCKSMPAWSSDLSMGGVPNDDYSVPPQCLSPQAFANVPTSPGGVPLRVGTAPRYLDHVTGPRQVSEAVRISKAFPLYGERMKFKIGATWQNPFKRTYAYLTDTTVGDSAFGQMLEGGANRTLQLEARIDF